MFAIHLCAPNDSNGNPRRLFLIMDSNGNPLKAIDEGCFGTGAIYSDPEIPSHVGGVPFRMDTSITVNVSASEYRGWLKEFGNRSLSDHFPKEESVL